MARTVANNLNRLEARLKLTRPSGHHLDDEYVLLTLWEAIAAARDGNFGVGAVLVREDGKVVVTGRNRVFSPYFRSDLHAEMDVVTQFEEQFREVTRTAGYVLYSSLKPCPMCLARLITSGIRKVYYAAEDPTGGMVHKLKDMPQIWKKLGELQEFLPARCSPVLSELAQEISEVSLEQRNQELLRRRL